ncbi:hypothetical protein BpHYR1_042998 [Brachionus plicatilis]|uniref:Uncharacterized protein n=1 Tax=Brachionus plicatilis TaxID=10195 RepID=A0A3M7SM50_BRAPC|nr:hypothetical protein BpHYR1_042998 [Brachionus plicatilis]
MLTLTLSTNTTLESILAMHIQCFNIAGTSNLSKFKVSDWIFQPAKLCRLEWIPSPKVIIINVCQSKN